VRLGKLLEIRSDLCRPPAPMWHTLLLLLYLLVPVSRWPGATQYISQVQTGPRFGIYLFEAGFQLFGVFLVLSGLYINKTRFRELLGRLWQTAEDGFRDIYLGVLFWLLAIGLSVFTYYALGASYTKPSRILPRTPHDLLLFVPFAVIAGLCEELMFRGYLFNQLKCLTGSVEIGVVVQAMAFSAAHGYDQTIAGVINNFMFGIAFGVLANWKNSLIPAIIGHSWLDVSVGIAAVLFP
jgi:uncharacterized protein